MEKPGELLFSYQRDNDFQFDEEGNPLCYILNGYTNGYLVYKTFEPHHDDGTFLSVNTYDVTGTLFFRKLKALLKKMTPVVIASSLTNGLPVSGDSLDFFSLSRKADFAGYTNRVPVGPTPSYYQKDYKKYVKEDFANEMGEDLNELDSLFFSYMDSFDSVPNGYESTEMSLKGLLLLASNGKALSEDFESNFYESSPWLPHLSNAALSKTIEDNKISDELKRSFDNMLLVGKEELPILTAILNSHNSQDEVDEKILSSLLKLGLAIDPQAPDLADASSLLTQMLLNLIGSSKVKSVKGYAALPPSFPVLLRYFLAHPLPVVPNEEPLPRIRRMLKQYRKDALAHHLMPYYYQFTDEGGGVIIKSKPALA
jgi:hypothetical protein